jgi:hypothetical protein
LIKPHCHASITAVDPIAVGGLVVSAAGTTFAGLQDVQGRSPQADGIAEQ